MTRLPIGTVSAFETLTPGRIISNTTENWYSLIDTQYKAQCEDKGALGKTFN